MQSKCSRLLFLNNISKDETIVFVWQRKALDFGEVRVPCVCRMRTSRGALDSSHPIPPRSSPSHPTPSHPTPSHPLSRLVSYNPCEGPETPSQNKQVSVSPMRGEVAPEETIPFVVTLKASVHASFYSMDLVCKVGSALARSWDGAQLPVLRCGVVCEIPRPPERGKGQPLEEWGAHRTGPGQGPPDLRLLSPCPEPQVYRQKLLTQYRKELQEWEDEKVRQEVEFTITDRKAKVMRAGWALNTTELSDWPCQRGQRW